MDASRRRFLKQGLTATACSGALGLIGTTGWTPNALGAESSEDAELGLFPILQGWTDETTAQFRILTDMRYPVAYRIKDSKGSELAFTHFDRITHPSSKRDAIDHIQVLGLRVGETFYLEIVEPTTGKVLDRREFEALETSRPDARFAMLSCMNDSFVNAQKGMWKAVARSAPSVLFYIGDACYADSDSDGSEADLWRRFVETRKRLDVFKWRKLVPSLAVWDDHDYGLNNSDSRSPLKHAAKIVFQAHFGSQGSPGRLEHGPGISSCANLFGQRFFLMDDRFFRSEPNIRGGTHWGDEQEEWLFSQLGASRAPAWLFNGSQFFGGYLGKESFEGNHPEQFERVMKRLAALDAPVMFGSGDVHFSEVMKIEKRLLGYETFEFTSSSVHSFTVPGHQYRARNPRRMESTSKHNFLLIQSGPDANGDFAIRAKARGAENSAIFDQRVVVRR